MQSIKNQFYINYASHLKLKTTETRLAYKKEIFAYVFYVKLKDHILKI